MKKALFISFLTALALNTASVSGLWWVVDDYMHSDERRNEKIAFLDQVIKESLGAEYKEFKIIEDYAEHNGHIVCRKFVKSNESENEYSEYLMFILHNHLDPQKSSKDQKIQNKLYTISRLNDPCTMRKIRMGEPHYEEINSTIGEHIGFAECKPRDSSNDFPGYTTLVRLVQKGRWEVAQIYVCEKSKMNAENKQKWIRKFQNSETVGKWIARCDSEIAGK